MSVKQIFVLVSVFLMVIITDLIYFFPNIWWISLIFGPIILLGVFDSLQKHHAIRRNFPVIGHLRYLLEEIRPEIMQYFVETDTEGRPFNRLYRSLVYQRAKKVTDTTPFGTQMDVYRAGYEWMEHSIYPKKNEVEKVLPRVTIGGPDCKQPYSASILNISAMSFGSLSKNAITALNKGAKIDDFYHNTGEGGISRYHLENKGDLVWQIGTAYFGCRTKDGNFDPKLFEEESNLYNVKMIEIKISQGAKPGHGGILPAIKNTEEIARIRGVEPHTEVLSPSGHTAFSNPTELVEFIKKLRELSNGKPIGFKLCLGRKKEFIDICKAMLETGIKPDFIAIDGGEGGTGAAPVEFTNSMGYPLREGLCFVYDTLVGFDLKKDINIIASGKITSSFHIARILALGADLCNSARGMMMALGCIQALRCNKNTCPVGVTTQDISLMKGLNVNDKSVRVANFHHQTLESLIELVEACGLNSPSELNRAHINRRISMAKVSNYLELYPPIKKGCLLNSAEIPDKYRMFFSIN